MWSQHSFVIYACPTLQSDVDGSDGGVGAGDGDGRVGSLNRQPDELLLIRASAQLFERLAVGRLAVNFGEANASNHTLAI